MISHWNLGHLRDFDIVNEIEQGSERVTLIVGLAFIDDHLTDAIRATLRKKITRPISDKWFGERGFYRDFQAKIDIALMLGIIGKITHGDLVRLARARNEVAHKSRHKVFQSASIKGLCRDLELPERLKIGAQWTNKKDPKERFLFVVASLTSLLNLWTFSATGQLAQRRRPPKKARLP